MSFSIDTTGFLGAMDAAARYIGAGQGTEAALRPEIGKVLERAVVYTKAPEEEELRQRVEYGLRRKFNTYAAGEVGDDARKRTPRISNCPDAGHTWWVDTDKHGQRKFYLMNGGPRKRWGNRFARYQAEESDRLADLDWEIQDYLPKALASRGVTKQSWVQIADELGLRISPPGISWIRGARPTTGRSYVNGLGSCSSDRDGILFRLENRMPSLTNPRRPGADLEGSRILQAAFDTREKAIMIGIEKGIFDDLDKALRRFPGVALLR